MDQGDLFQTGLVYLILRLRNLNMFWINEKYLYQHTLDMCCKITETVNTQLWHFQDLISKLSWDSPTLIENPLIIDATGPEHKVYWIYPTNKQWYHCREWQNSKCTWILCGYICLKKYILKCWNTKLDHSPHRIKNETI